MSKLITNKKTYIVTTSLPYVNSIPHIGFAFEAVIADTISRYLRSIGKKVVFISGTDDNSFKLALKAKELGEEVQSFIDDFSEEFLKLQEKLCLSYDVFYRTSSKSHGDFVNKYIDSINKSLIFQKNFRSYFCQDCESFVGFDIPEPKICKYHNKPYILIDENNYFLRVGDKSKEKLFTNINSKVFIPESAKDESISLCEKFTDFNFTRENKHQWGIVYEKDKNYVFYSFFDALLGYIGAAEYKKTDWDSNDICIIQNIGRDILKFHSIYFPFMITISSKKHTPDYLLVHGFVNKNGEKMSKSKNNLVSVNDLLIGYDKYVIRIYLLSKNISEDFEFILNEIVNISNIYKKYLAYFSEEIRRFKKGNVTNIDFHKNMLQFQFSNIVNKFILIIKNNDSFEKLSQSDRVFIKEFSLVFIY